MKTRKEITTDPTLGVLFVDIKQVCGMFNLGQSTIWRLIGKGKFPEPIYFGRSARWKVTDLRGWAERLSA